MSIVIAVLLIACGGGDGDEGEDTEDIGGDTVVTTAATDSSSSSPTTVAAEVTTTDDTGGQVAGSDEGECTITLSGDRDDTWTFPQDPYTTFSDYFMTEDELREMIEFLGEEAAGGTYEEIVARGEPIFSFLALGCYDPEETMPGVTLTHTNATTSSDLPMAPGSYPISGGFFEADGPAGTMIADFNVSDDELYGTVDGSGSLEITRWDSEVIEGTFGFDAKEAFVDSGREVRVEVTFSYRCPASPTGC
jgi:hypothetical protein